MRSYRIDILRAIAILLVLLHHFNIPYKLHDTFLGVELFGESLSTLLARNGNYGVTLFFVISGFLITQHSLQRSQGQLANIQVKNFYIRRIARIVPCLLLLVLMVSGLAALELKPFMNQAPNDIAVSYGLTVFAALSFWMNLLIIQFGWVNYAFGVLWSLSVEEVFYLIFPILCVLLPRVKALALVLLAVICYAPYFRALHFGDENGAYLYHYFASFDAIAIGCLTALWAQARPRSTQLPFYLQGLAVMIMLGVYFYAPIKAVSTWSMTLFALAAAVMVYAASLAKNPQQPHLVQRILVWIGQRSYEMYLFHLLILGIFKVFYVPKTTLPQEKLWLLLLYFIATFLLSAVIERYYARPLNGQIRQRWLSKD
ncbi:acyltransferase family protein [Acinetobacter larvae]|uniref:Acyltransferase n=1 Tax=Acinetobacter larvae TaxID=1789224 RepID=A0A1B2LWN2_9GAMM|nr:acyltransferase [Acinetobacter larvae]AOA57351.1 acyltransferase [Acinetobacter larvae]